MRDVALQFGPLTIHWYGVLVVTGFMLGLWTASRRGLRDNFAPEKIMDLGPWLLGGAIVGSRLLYVISYWQDDFARQPIWEIFMIQKGGLVFYGGLIGASLCLIVYVRLKKMPLWKLADVLAPSVALAHVFGRLGCLMHGCCFGYPTAVAWAIHFPKDHATHGVGVHPTQIYESLLNLALYAALAWGYRRKKFDGQIFAIYLLAYACLRSFVELFRGDYLPASRMLDQHLTPAQFVSVFLLIGGAVLYWRRSRAAAPKPPCAK